MFIQRRLDGAIQAVANEVLLLRKLGKHRRSASWQAVVKRWRGKAADKSARAPTQRRDPGGV